MSEADVVDEPEADTENVSDVELVTEGDPVLVADEDALPPLAVELAHAVTLADPQEVLLGLEVSHVDVVAELVTEGEPVLVADTDAMLAEELPLAVTLADPLADADVDAELLTEGHLVVVADTDAHMLDVKLALSVMLTLTLPEAESEGDPEPEEEEEGLPVNVHPAPAHSPAISTITSPHKKGRRRRRRNKRSSMKATGRWRINSALCVALRLAQVNFFEPYRAASESIAPRRFEALALRVAPAGAGAAGPGRPGRPP